MSCLYFVPPGRVELRELERPQAAAGEALVEVVVSGVSPGTELRCLAGQQAGTPPGGFIPGYQCAGRVLECPDGTFKTGQSVFSFGTTRGDLARTWGGHVSHAVAPVEKLFALPEGLPLETAVFAKLAAISHHGAQLAGVQAGERVVVIGLGPIGFFSAQVLHAAGHAVTAYDLSAARVGTASTAGIAAVQIHRDQPTGAQVAAGGPCDVIIDCTGVEGLIAELLQAGKELPWADHSERGVRYVIQGSYPGNFSIPYDEVFMKEATLLFPRDIQPRDLWSVLVLMGEGKVGLPAAMMRIADPAQAQQAYEALAASRDLPLSVAFKWT